MPRIENSGEATSHFTKLFVLRETLTIVSADATSHFTKLFVLRETQRSIVSITEQEQLLQLSTSLKATPLLTYQAVSQGDCA